MDRLRTIKPRKVVRRGELLRGKQIKNLKDKRVLLRTDFNVPILSERSEVTKSRTRRSEQSERRRVGDDYRIRMALPTIQYLLKQKSKIIIISHLGRPEGKRVGKFSLKPAALRLEKLLKQKVFFVNQSVGKKVEQAVKLLEPCQVLMLENIRFQPGEETNCSRLAKKLASYADIYINDAFAVSHRKHSSVSAITKYLPSYAGLLLEKEINNLSKALNPQKPSVAILGGAKISTKIKLIENLLKHFDKILIGGAIANNFIQAAGYEIGKSLVDVGYKLNLRKYDFNKIELPVDVVVAKGKELRAKGLGLRAKVKDVDEVKKSDKILDIGPETIEMFQNEIKKAKTIVWNGPMGLFEDKKFAKGTNEIAKAVLQNKKARVVIGGGETVAALKGFGPRAMGQEHIFVSTGGGAMLEFLEGKTLPGVEALME